jgi:hypothetical protein
MMFTKRLTSAVVAVALLSVLGLAGCSGRPNQPRVANHSAAGAGQDFSTVGLGGSNMYGGRFSAGVLVVSHSTGVVSSCWKTCIKIGTIDRSGPGELSLESVSGFQVYITNLVSGHVVHCEVESDGFAESFGGGKCEDVGSAATPADPPRHAAGAAPDKPAEPVSKDGDSDKSAQPQS